MKPLPSIIIIGACALVLMSAAPPLSAQQTDTNAQERVFEFGFDQRVRNENWNNILDYSQNANDEREQIRYRTRIWMKAPVTSTIDAFVGLNQETYQKFGSVNKFDEVFFDAAYLDFKRLFVKGLSFRVGRQDLMRGEGFILFEGNPGDGSRAIYFNAADLSYSFRKSKVELIGILDPKQDRFLPVMNDVYKPLMDWDEQALGVYYTDKNLSRTSIEAYYFYKKEVNDQKPYLNPRFQPDRHIHTVGARTVHQLTPHWTGTAEMALQWGTQHPGTPISAWAGYGYLKRTFGHRWRPYIQTGYWGFSGDDPKTKDRIEGWDPLFSRWPKWSELYLYSQWKEYGVGYTTNTSMWQGEAGFFPKKQLGLRCTYYHMDSFQPFDGNTQLFANGTTRGDMFQARVDVIPNAHWKGHVLWENLLPGDFYRGSDNAWFLRFEISYQITGVLHAGSL